MARYFSVLLIMSGVVSAIVHPLPNLTDMTMGQRFAITATCLVSGSLIWVLPWDRWPRMALMLLPPIGLGVKTWANLYGGLGPYSYSIHFVLIYVWMGVALPRWTPLCFSPLLGLCYVMPLIARGDPRQTASVAMVLPICVLIGESVAWISNRLRDAEQIDGQRMLRMEWLVRASSDFARDQERDELCERIARLANELPEAAGAAVLLPGPGRTLETIAAAGWTGELPESFSITENPVLVDVLRSGDFRGYQTSECIDLAAKLGVSRVGVASLSGSTRCVGVLLLARRFPAERFDSFMQGLVRTLLVQAGLAIERVRERETLRDATLHDELTKLGNRRKANARLGRLAPGDALVLIDLDHFKGVNDRLGHAGGDQVLKDLASFLAQKLREGDQAFRLGGEEFLLVLDQAGEGALMAAERLCGGWRAREPVTTFSSGVAIHQEGVSPDETLDYADQALYAAKEAGRDRVARY